MPHLGMAHQRQFRRSPPNTLTTFGNLETRGRQATWPLTMALPMNTLTSLPAPGTRTLMSVAAQCRSGAVNKLTVSFLRRRWWSSACVAIPVCVGGALSAAAPSNCAPLYNATTKRYATVIAAVVPARCCLVARVMRGLPHISSLLTWCRRQTVHAGNLEIRPAP